MIERWCVTFSFSGLSLSLGVLIWLIWRNRERDRHERERRVRKFLEEARNEGHPEAEELERRLREKN